MWLWLCLFIIMDKNNDSQLSDCSSEIFPLNVFLCIRHRRIRGKGIMFSSMPSGCPSVRSLTPISRVYLVEKLATTIYHMSGHCWKGQRCSGKFGTGGTLGSPVSLPSPPFLFPLPPLLSPPFSYPPVTSPSFPSSPPLPLKSS